MKRCEIHKCLGTAALVLAAGSATAGDWQFLPILKDGYKPDLVVSVVGGVLDPKGAGEDTYAGLEVAMNCGLFQTPTGVVRTKISYGGYDHDGLEYRSFEINPRWTIPVAQNLSFGIGPGIGYVRTEVGSRETDLFAWQLGADLDYRVGRVSLGLGVRWQDTVSKTIAPDTDGAENWLVQAKIGYAF